MGDINEAKVVLSDDLNHAEVIINPKWTLHFSRQRLSWQIEISDFMKDTLPYPQIPKRGQILMKMANEIRQGKYATFKEANDELVRALSRYSMRGPG